MTHQKKSGILFIAGGVFSDKAGEQSEQKCGKNPLLVDFSATASSSHACPVDQVTPNDPPSHGVQGAGEEVPRTGVPMSALFREINPYFLNDLRVQVPILEDELPQHPLQPLVSPIWAPVPANFFLCEACWGIWVREELEYTQNFFCAQQTIIETLPEGAEKKAHQCDECGGAFLEYSVPLPPGEYGPLQEWYVCQGAISDRRGRWLYVDSRVVLEAQSGSAGIARIFLRELNFTDSPTPLIAFFRLKDWVPGRDRRFYKRRVEWEKKWTSLQKNPRASQCLRSWVRSMRSLIAPRTTRWISMCVTTAWGIGRKNAPLCITMYI